VATDPERCITATTVSNLFVRPEDVEELLGYEYAGLPASHGNTERYAARREQVFAAAIWLLSKSPGAFKDAVSLADALERLPMKFWDEMRPPLSLRKMTELISHAVATGKVLRK
jgi:hypothetical protein